MRVTSNTYTNLLLQSSQSAQSQLATLQTEISSGNTIQNPSDNPTAYSNAAQDQATLDQLNTFTTAASTATTLTTANNTAMTNLHQIVAQAGEYLAGVSSNMSSADLQNLGTQMSTLVSELTSIVNQKDSNGDYMFGGTANQAPINTTTGDYNTGTNGDTTSIEVEQGNNVQTSVAAGNPGPPAVDGFLYDSSSGTDVLASLTQAVTDLNSGNTTALLGTDKTAVNNALNLVSTYVGSTAANMSAATTASTQLGQQTASIQNTIGGLVQTNLPTAMLQLQQLNNQYEASLEAGTRVLSMSILNYMSQISTT